MNPPNTIAEPHFEMLNPQPQLNVQRSEYKRLLGFPSDHLLDGRTLELVEWAGDWYAQHGHPWIYARQSGSLQISDDKLIIGRTAFRSESLVNLIAQAGAHDVVLTAVSAGSECEARAQELWAEGKPDEYFFMEIYGSAVVEHLVTVASGEICRWADQHQLAVLPHYSPGYSGWTVADQVKLWQVLRPKTSSAAALALEVMDTGMLKPKKSLLAMMGLTRHLDRVRTRWIPCESCSLPSCQYRRAPYTRFRAPIDDVRRLQGMEEDFTANTPEVSPALVQGATYSINRNALRKWARDRLAVTTLADRSTEACFRYEGTTCSNMGAPLEFHYYVTLGPPELGYRITRAECAPAHDDRGHTKMCEYLNDASTLMGSIANERPLLGHPLNDVLTWDVPHHPSGCYCDAERRAHKWRLVYEVIHYALAERDRRSANVPQL